MKVTKKKMKENVIRLTITVDNETFQEGVNQAYKETAKKINIPGFRKGKAPRKIIEQYYGEGVFYEDAINIICPKAYEEALEKTKIEPVDRPEIDIEKIGGGENFVFTATVTVKPEVELGEYEGVEVEKITYKTSAADVNAEIKKAQEQNARIITVEDRKVKKGDLTVIDFEGFCDGVAFPGGKGEDYNLEIGSGAFIPGFEDQLVGCELNKEKEINVKFPEEYHAEDLKGKDAMFKVTVKEIKEKQLPELDDDFAKDVSEFETFEEYKKDVKAKLTKANNEKAKMEQEDKVVEKVCELCKVNIPECMINTQLDNIARDFNYRLAAQGLSLEQYLNMTGSTLESFKEQFKDQAETQVKTSLVLEAIAEKEKIEAKEKDVEEQMTKMAEQYNMELDKVKTLFTDADLDSLKAEIKAKKVIELLVKKANIK